MTFIKHNGQWKRTTGVTIGQAIDKNAFDNEKALINSGNNYDNYGNSNFTFTDVIPGKLYIISVQCFVNALMTPTIVSGADIVLPWTMPKSKSPEQINYCFRIAIVKATSTSIVLHTDLSQGYCYWSLHRPEWQ